MSDFFNEQKGQVYDSNQSKGTFQVGSMDRIPSTALKSLISDTTFSNYLLFVDAYSKIPKLYGTKKITRK